MHRQEELKSRAAHVSQEYTRRSEQYKRSVLAPPEPTKPTPPPVVRFLCDCGAADDH